MFSTPLVDIIIGTYNHEKFISEAVNSVLAQETDFSYRIIIGDDGSSDRTPEIIKSYALKYPDRIKTILLKQNKGLIGKDVMRRKLYESCKAEYVAMLEGDDYWTDSKKLQKQVEFLGSHPECALCSHPVKIIYSDERTRHWGDICGENEKEFYSIEDILRSNKWPEIPTPGLMLRWSVITELPEWFWQVLRADTALHLLFTHYGKAGFLKECMAVHRKHGGGVSKLFDTDPDYMNKDLLDVFLYFDKHFDYKYHCLLEKHITPLVDYFDAKKMLRQGEEEFGKGNIEEAKSIFLSLIERWPNYVDAYNNLGVIYWESGDLAYALRYFTKVIQLDPYERNAVLNCGKLLISIGKFEEARRLYLHYLGKKSDNEIKSILDYFETPNIDIQTHDIDSISGHHKVFHKFSRWEGIVERGYRRDFLGILTRKSFFTLMNEQDETTQYPSYGEDYFEYIDVLESVLSAHERFTMIELGAGFGRWMVKAAVALRQANNLPCKLIGVEAEPDHYKWMRLHFLDNGIDPDQHQLIEAAVADKDGSVSFHVGKPDEWYGQSIVETAGSLPGVKTVQSVSLSTLLRPLDRVDLIDMDVQGAELMVLAAAADDLNVKVNRVHIGTHSRDIEAGLRALFRYLGWKCLNDYPCGSESQTPYGIMKFGDGVQTWINPCLS